MVDLHRFDLYSVDLGISQEMAWKIPWGMALEIALGMAREMAWGMAWEVAHGRTQEWIEKWLYLM